MAEKPRRRWVLWVVVTLVVLIGGGAGAYLALKPGGAAEPEPIEPVSYQVESITTNLARTADGPRRFVRLQVELMITDEAAVEALRAGGEGQGGGPAGAIRDAIISSLRSHTDVELDGALGMEVLKKDIKERVEAILGEGTIGEVHLVDFLIQ